MIETIILSMILILAAVVVFRRLKKVLTVGEEGPVCDHCPVATTHRPTTKK